MIKSATLIAIRDDFLETNIILNKGFTVDSRLVTLKCLISVNRERTHVYVKVLGLLEADYTFIIIKISQGFVFSENYSLFYKMNVDSLGLRVFFCNGLI